MEFSACGIALDEFASICPCCSGRGTINVSCCRKCDGLGVLQYSVESAPKAAFDGTALDFVEGPGIHGDALAEPAEEPQPAGDVTSRRPVRGSRVLAAECLGAFVLPEAPARCWAPAGLAAQAAEWPLTSRDKRDRAYALCDAERASLAHELALVESGALFEGRAKGSCQVVLPATKPSTCLGKDQQGWAQSLEELPNGAAVQRVQGDAHAGLNLASDRTTLYQAADYREGKLDSDLMAWHSFEKAPSSAADERVHHDAREDASIVLR